MKKLKLVLPTNKKKFKISIFDISIFIILAVYVISLFIPIIWAAYSSMNDKMDYLKFYTLHDKFPTHLVLDNFKLALNDYVYHAESGYDFTFIDMIGNSIIYSVGCAFFYTLTPCLVAYCAARFKFRFSKVIYAFVIITMSLPIIGAMPSEIRMLKTLGIFDTFFGMFVLRANFLSIYFLIFYAQFQMIPMTYSEAAKVDGASNFKIMTRIIIPQAIPTIVTVFLLSFISFWNDYQIPRFYLPSSPTVSLGLFVYTNSPPMDLSAIPIQLAALIGLTIPIVVVFAILNKYLKLNVATGGIKG
jgi:multiple sugar transport system permease protein